MHRWDAATLVAGPAEPIPAPVAVDGIAEFFDEFVATALARGLVPPAARTLALEISRPRPAAGVPAARPRAG